MLTFHIDQDLYERLTNMPDQKSFLNKAIREYFNKPKSEAKVSS